MKGYMSILLIEDDQDDQEFFIEVLKRCRGSILYGVVGNGKEAIDLLSTCSVYPDLIFTDLNMPIMNGKEFLSRVANIPGVCNIPVVVLSDNVDIDQIAEKFGVQGFIPKMSDSKIFQREIERMLKIHYIRSNEVADLTFLLCAI